MKPIHFIILVALCHLSFSSDSSTVSKLITINRHGIRAPNSNFLDYCPKDYSNYYSYDVGPDMLTGLGMSQLLQLGEYLRATYPSIFTPYRENDHYLRSADATRCIQSANAATMSIWNGTGPSGFLPGFPSPVAVNSQSSDTDDLLACSEATCHDQSRSDEDDWYDDEGIDLVEQEQDFIRHIESICGGEWLDMEDSHATFKAFKTVSDGLNFDELSGFPRFSQHLTDYDLVHLRNVTYDYVTGRSLSKDKQVTYEAGELPATILDAFYDGTQSYQGFWSHRETLYTLSAYFEFDFYLEDVEPAPGIVPPASTFLFELNDMDGEFYVSPSLWYINSEGESTVVPLTFGELGHVVALDDLQGMVDDRVDRTGSYTHLCK
eukprot:gnl/Dysnectes_brevis/1629_a1854_2900.p1 GENE.gnl/Dysnectes_brevis/1629_a1854_2900~~gnl/Dysnectes_brevis/1629_a1854_2900.p1  ORF type:complete len:395 (+),score=122.16 gnl/Dysnectes_brevis/1629_a1854_2900:54-1187(+)